MWVDFATSFVSSRSSARYDLPQWPDRSTYADELPLQKMHFAQNACVRTRDHTLVEVVNSAAKSFKQQEVVVHDRVD